jgi:hypothetical protein
MAESDDQKTRKVVVALAGRAMDSTLSIPERIAALKGMEPVLRVASRGVSGAAVAGKLLELQYVDFACRAGLVEACAYAAIGDLNGCTDVAQVAEFACAKWTSWVVLMDGWGSHSHPEWRHQWFDSFYAAVPVALRQMGELLDRGMGSAPDAVLQRTQELLALFNDGGVGGKVIISPWSICLNPHGLGNTANHIIVAGGAYEAASISLREDPLDGVEMYAAALVAAMAAAPSMADSELTAQLFESGVLDAVVVHVQRAQAAETPVHINVNRCNGQLVAGVATTAEGRAKLKSTAGLEDALMWLLENGGDPIGIAENKTLTDPCGMAGLCLALLRGREEDAQLALPVKVVRQIAQMVDTYYAIGGASMAVPYVQGLAEVSVSDTNKEHLKSVPGVVDSLRVCLGIDSSSDSDPQQAKLRTFACNTLAQLAASELSLPMLLGHPVLDDLERVPNTPHTSKDARNDAMAVLFAVRQHEKAVVNGTDGVARPKNDSDDGQHVMISYPLCATLVQIQKQTFVRYSERDSRQC